MRKKHGKSEKELKPFKERSLNYQNVFEQGKQVDAQYPKVVVAMKTMAKLLICMFFQQ